MSTTDPNDLRDPRFDAAWRAASREEPPKALDDAIRAAARREVGSGPQSAEAKALSVPSALRPESWWAPLAAAAAIGAIAIGILQLVHSDHVDAPASDKGVITDMPEAPAKAKVRDDIAREAAAPVTPAPPQSVAPPPPQSVAPAPPQSVAPPPPQSVAPSPAKSQASQQPAANTAARERSETKQVAGQPAEQSAVQPAPASPPASMPALRKDAAAASSVEERAAVNAPSPAAEPFPADALKREAKQAAAVAPPPASMPGEAATSGAAVAPPPASTPAEAATSGLAAGKLSSAPAPAAQGASMSDAQRATAPFAQSPAPKPAAPVRRMQESDAARAPAATGGARTAGLDANASASADVRAKTAQKLAVPDWIALIRKLRDEGKMEEATKELAAFRAAYPDHERLLPPDLRDWKPAAR